MNGRLRNAPRWLRCAGEAFAGMMLLGIVAVVVAYRTVPTHTTDGVHFDTLIVLGCPTEPDGHVSPVQRERVLEGVREYKAGRADFMIVSGGTPHNQFTEAFAMAGFAEREGIPADHLVVEPQARNTIENIYYSHKIMEKRGWTSAEVVSTPDHLPRVGLILEHYSFKWRTHASRWPQEYSLRLLAPYYIREAMGTAVLRWFGYRPSSFLPR